MQNIWEQIQPSVTTIVITVVGILTTIVLSLLTTLKTRVNLWIDTKISASQRELVHKIANEAFAHAETMFKDKGGEKKMNEALIYASDKLGKVGIKVTVEELKAAIHEACLKYNADKVKVLKDGNKAS